MNFSELLREVLPDLTEVRESGRNVTEKAFGIHCPFCGDRNFHMGVFRSARSGLPHFSCWRCGRTGGLIFLLRALGAKEGLVERVRLFAPSPDRAGESRPSVSAPLPQGCVPIIEKRLGQSCLQFLRRRRIPLTTCNRYGAQYHPGWQRLVIPIVDRHGTQCSWTARSVREDAFAKYVSAPGTNLHDHLYGLDRWLRFASAAKTMLVVEGPLDVWRLGDCAVGTFGTSISERQVALAADAQPRMLLMLWDGDAVAQARRAAWSLAPVVQDVRVAALPDGEDPDSAGPELLEEAVGKAERI